MRKEIRSARTFEEDREARFLLPTPQKGFTLGRQDSAVGPVAVADTAEAVQWGVEVAGKALEEAALSEVEEVPLGVGQSVVVAEEVLSAVVDL